MKFEEITVDGDIMVKLATSKLYEELRKKIDQEDTYEIALVQKCVTYAVQ
jgi:hypothetical protein